MTRLATLHLKTVMLVAGSQPFGLLDERIRAIGSLASVALALIVWFTTVRYQRLTADLDRVALRRFDRGAIPALLLDAVVVAVTVAACTAMLSLFRESVNPADWLSQAHVVESVFCVMYVAFVGLALFQLSIVGRRLRGHLR